MKRAKTIFEKIIDREIPGHIIYEDDMVIAFLDIAPVHAGHTLVVPKKWSRNMLDMSDQDRDAVFKVAQKVARALKDELGADGVNLIMNNEPAAGQIVFHSHIHVIPRYEGDGLGHWQKNPNYSPDQADGIAEKIKARLS